MAAPKGSLEYTTRRPRSKLTSEVQLHLSGSLLFTVDKELLAQKSAKLAKLLQKSPQEDISLLLRDIPADQESLDIVSRFCHGFDINLTTDNVVRVACVADYLGMTDTHCPNNLLSKALSFFGHEILPSWNNSIKAIKTAECVLQQALELGLIDYCAESILNRVIEDPRLLGEPIMSLPCTDDDSDENEHVYRPNARRKLFDVDWKSEDLTTLSLRLYSPIIHAMNQRNVPEEYVAANICQYAKTWLFSENSEDSITIHKRNSQREIIEALESLLPDQRGIVTTTFLFQMLQFAMAVDANNACLNGLELKIGKQLDQACVKDLLIPSQGYAKEEQYDTECVKRILKHFYCNCSPSDPSGLVSVAELIDEFLAEISSDIDLTTSSFLAIADMSVAASSGTERTSDGLYRALDIYLDKHRHLTDLEREELCRVLDCNKMSMEACEHAAQNERLPMRVAVQVLFVAQLKIKESIVGPRDVRTGGMLRNGEEDGDGSSGGEDVMKAEIEKMGSKVMELERECGVMRREIQRGGGVDVRKEKKRSVWGELKRKLGCVTSSVHDQSSNCHVKKKKVHPR